MLYVRCSAETAIINLMVFLIHVVLRSGAEIVIFVNTNRYIYIFLRSKHDWMSDAAAMLVIFIQDNMSLNKTWHNREHVSDRLLCMDHFFLLVHQDYHRFHYNVCSSTD